MLVRRSPRFGKLKTMVVYEFECKSCRDGRVQFRTNGSVLNRVYTPGCFGCHLLEEFDFLVWRSGGYSETRYCGFAMTRVEIPTPTKELRERKRQHEEDQRDIEWLITEGWLRV